MRLYLFTKIGSIFFACLVLAVLVISPFKSVYAVATCDPVALRAQRINFVDCQQRNTAGCSATTTLTGSDPEEKSWNYFIGKGLSAVQTAGIMGNLQQESSFNPEEIQGGGSSADPNAAGSGGWGLAQWTPGSKIIGIAQSLNITTPINDLQTQLDIIWGEMQNTTPAGVNNMLASYQQITDLSQATDEFTRKFEAAGIVGPRLQYAQDALTKYGSSSGSGTVSGPSNTPSQSGGASCVSASAGQYTNPFRDVPNIAQAGIDAGVDYSGDGPVHPIGNGTITDANPNSHWVGGNAVSYKLSDGPAAGKLVYVAENCTVDPSMSVGKAVTPNDTLCTMHNAYPYIETGWAEDKQNSSTPLPYTDNCYYIVNPSIGQKTSTAYGVNFDQLMQKLGVPKASTLGGNITCTLPADWPAWQ